jgi:hypothetical protein
MHLKNLKLLEKQKEIKPVKKDTQAARNGSSCLHS